MRICLFNKLKKRLHKDIAELQDQIVDIVYTIFPDILFHGGTSIWRCYFGNRFSEDLDFYFPRQSDIKEKLNKELIINNLKLIKFKETENVIFSKISNNNIIVQLEIRLLDKFDSVFKKAIPVEYEKLDGSTITVFCLSQEDLLLEKARTYLNRKLIRDIYDVYFLSNFAKLNKEQLKEIKILINKFVKPVDETNLKAIVYLGAVPSYTQMLTTIKRRF
jgi:predicted nucleotidyltransferase component of viral defense system